MEQCTATSAASRWGRRRLGELAVSKTLATSSSQSLHLCGAVTLRCLIPAEHTAVIAPDTLAQHHCRWAAR